MHPCRAAREKHHHRPNQRANGRHQNRPRSGAIVRSRTRICTPIIHIALDNAEEHKVDDARDSGDQESEQRDDRRQKGPDGACAEGKEEGDEVDAAGDGVENHGAGEGAGGVVGVVGELRAVLLGEDVGGGVADVRAGAVVAGIVLVSSVF